MIGIASGNKRNKRIGVSGRSFEHAFMDPFSIDESDEKSSFCE
jgi:hypothetical protein